MHSNRNSYAHYFTVAFLGCLIYITLFSRNANLTSVVRCTPFWSYNEWFTGRLDYRKSIFLNIILFIPLGYLLYDSFKSFRWGKPYRFTMIASLCLSIIIEISQYFTGRGLCDVDDIINNFLGGFIGAYCSWRFGEKGRV